MMLAPARRERSRARRPRPFPRRWRAFERADWGSRAGPRSRSAASIRPSRPRTKSGGNDGGSARLARGACSRRLPSWLPPRASPSSPTGRFARSLRRPSSPPARRCRRSIRSRTTTAGPRSSSRRRSSASRSRCTRRARAASSPPRDGPRPTGRRSRPRSATAASTRPRRGDRLPRERRPPGGHRRRRPENASGLTQILAETAQSFLGMDVDPLGAARSPCGSSAPSAAGRRRARSAPRAAPQDRRPLRPAKGARRHRPLPHPGPRAARARTSSRSSRTTWASGTSRT